MLKVNDLGTNMGMQSPQARASPVTGCFARTDGLIDRSPGRARK